MRSIHIILGIERSNVLYYLRQISFAFSCFFGSVLNNLEYPLIIRACAMSILSHFRCRKSTDLLIFLETLGWTRVLEKLRQK